jgi:SAM-dependent methyltransferase
MNSPAGHDGTAQSAATRWADQLLKWGIPQEILDGAPESPWTFPVSLFASRADAAVEKPTPSSLRALEALPEGGSVLDVGSGAGAASLPLAKRAGHITAVDTSEEMLEAFAERADLASTAFDAITGRWPDVEASAPVVDVLVCNHVVYNVPELDQFVRALTDHARRRVVIELTPEHPTSNMNTLWMRFHGLRRPEGPTADDAIAVVRETVGVEPAREEWTSKPSGSLSWDEMVAWTRRRLCLAVDRDREVADAMKDILFDHGDGRVSFGPRRVVALWWPGSAASHG